VKLETPR
jgi:hypothetical protein